MHSPGLRHLLQILPLALLGAMPALAAEEKACAHADCVRSPHGLIEIKPGENEAPGSSLLLDGEAIKTFDRRVHLRAAYPDREQASLVLLESADAKSCVMHRVLEVKGKDQVRLTAEFGNCQELVADADRARHGVAASVVFENDEWRIVLRPANAQDAGARVERYAYRDGKVFKEQIIAGRNADPEAAALKKLEVEVPDPEMREVLIRAHGSAYLAYRAILLKKGLDMDPRKRK